MLPQQQAVQVPPPLAQFGSEPASAEVRLVANWALHSGDPKGRAVVVVEHDMEFVMGLVDRIVVMDFGSKLCEGEPASVRNDPRVQEAYLHCAKAQMRSRLWSEEARVARNVMPSLNQIIHAQMGLTAQPESQESMVARYGAMIAAEQIKKS